MARYKNEAKPEVGGTFITLITIIILLLLLALLLLLPSDNIVLMDGVFFDHYGDGDDDDGDAHAMCRVYYKN